MLALTAKDNSRIDVALYEEKSDSYIILLLIERAN